MSMLDVSAEPPRPFPVGLGHEREAGRHVTQAHGPQLLEHLSERETHAIDSYRRRVEAFDFQEAA